MGYFLGERVDLLSCDGLQEVIESQVHNHLVGTKLKKYLIVESYVARLWIPYAHPIVWE